MLLPAVASEVYWGSHCFNTRFCPAVDRPIPNGSDSHYVTVIRSWLGHASLDTTNIYARANLETKRRALEKIAPSVRPGKPPRWKREVELLQWLDSL